MSVANAVEAAELISLKGITFHGDEKLTDIRIDLSEGKILALCHVPEGWRFNEVASYGEAGEYKDGGGIVKGDAETMDYALDAKNLSEWDGLLLVGPSTLHNKLPRFSGDARMFSISGNERHLKLGSKNFSVVPAKRCP